MQGQGGGRLGGRRHVAESMAAARERMAAARERHESQLRVAELVLGQQHGKAEPKVASSQQAIQSELVNLLQVAQQLRANGLVLEQAAAAAASAQSPASVAGYGDIQSELDALQIEAEEFNSELEGLRRSVAEAEERAPPSPISGRGDTIGMLAGLRLTKSRRELTIESVDVNEMEGEARMQQARSKLLVMVRLHNETAQRHGVICRQLETKRLALEALQRQLAASPAGQAPESARESRPPTARLPPQEHTPEQRVLQVVVEGRSDFPPVLAHQAQFGPTEVSVQDARCVQALPAVADRPLTNAQDLAGSVALIDRGVVPVVEKARRAQQAGAIAVVIVNTDDKGFAPSGAPHTHTHLYFPQSFVSVCAL